MLAARASWRSAKAGLTRPITDSAPCLPLPAPGDVEVVLGDDQEAVELYLNERARQERQWGEEHGGGGHQHGQRAGGSSSSRAEQPAAGQSGVSAQSEAAGPRVQGKVIKAGPLGQ